MAARLVLHDECDRHVLRLVRHRHARAVAHAAARQRRQRRRQVRCALRSLVFVQIVPLLVQEIVECDHRVHEREALLEHAVNELREREGHGVECDVRDCSAAHEARRVGRRQRRCDGELAVRVGHRLQGVSAAVTCTLQSPP